MKFSCENVWLTFIYADSSDKSTVLRPELVDCFVIVNIKAEKEKNMKKKRKMKKNSWKCFLWWRWVIDMADSFMCIFCSEHGVVWSVSMCCEDLCEWTEDGDQCCLPFASEGCVVGCESAVSDEPSCWFSRSGAFWVLKRRDATGSGAVFGLLYRID